MADQPNDAAAGGPTGPRPVRGRHRADPRVNNPARSSHDEPDGPAAVALPGDGRADRRLAEARAAEPTPPRTRRRWRRGLAWTAAVLVLVGAGVAGFGYFSYRHYDGRIHREDVLAPSDPHIVQKTKQEHAQNYLLIGSDTRAGANGKYETSAGEIAGARSDTTILAHLSPDGKSATMVSFPRDSWVKVPACRKPDGSTSKAYTGMFNSAFELGGASCTIRLVQSLTGVEINHYVQIDFTGFKTMVSALGGVPVCTPTPIDDPQSGLKLHAGTQTISGDQALAYVRARYSIGDGSDLGRIDRQHQFLAAMIRVATNQRILFSPGKLKHFLDAATKSVTLDRGTHLTDLYDLAEQLRELDAAHARLLTVPIADPDYTPPGQSEGGRVQLDLAAAKPLWKSIIEDNKTVTVPVSPSSASPSPTPTHRPANGLTVAPGQVKVAVVNGVGSPDLAGRASRALHGAGFQVTAQTVQPMAATHAIVRYGPHQAAAARTLAAAVPGATLQADPNGPADRVTLIVGSGFSGVHTVSVATTHRTGDDAPDQSGSQHASHRSGLSSVNAAQRACSLS